MAGNSESVKRSEKTKKEKYGPDFHSRIGADGGRVRTRGYFGMLKDQGKTAELKKLSKDAIEAKKTKSSGLVQNEQGGDGK